MEAFVELLSLATALLELAAALVLLVVDVRNARREDENRRQ